MRAAGLLVLGDVSGRSELTLPYPNWHAIVDMDGPAAVSSRRRLLKRAAGECMDNLPAHRVAGAR